jgi:hypothetical protein
LASSLLRFAQKTQKNRFSADFLPCKLRKQPDNRGFFAASSAKNPQVQQAARSFRCAQTFGLNIPTPKLRHIFAALKMLRISLFGPPNRRRTEGSQQPERYAQLDLNFFRNLKQSNNLKKHKKIGSRLSINSTIMYEKLYNNSKYLYCGHFKFGD